MKKGNRRSDAIVNQQDVEQEGLQGCAAHCSKYLTRKKKTGNYTKNESIENLTQITNNLKIIKL